MVACMPSSASTPAGQALQLRAEVWNCDVAGTRRADDEVEGGGADNAGIADADVDAKEEKGEMGCRALLTARSRVLEEVLAMMMVM